MIREIINYTIGGGGKYLFRFFWGEWNLIKLKLSGATIGKNVGFIIGYTISFILGEQ